MRPIRTKRTLRASNVENGSVYLGKEFCDQATLIRGGIISAQFVDRDGNRVEGGSGTLSDRWVVGGQTAAYRELGLSSGAQLQISTDEDAEGPRLLDIKVLSKSGGDYLHTDTTNQLAESLRLHPRDKRIVIYGLGTGPQGFKGGINTANDLLLRALAQAFMTDADSGKEMVSVRRVIVGGESVPLRVGDSRYLDEEDSPLETITFGQMITEIVHPTDQFELAIVIGHDHVTGAEALDAVKCLRDIWAGEDEQSAHDVRRIHFVHTAPTQIAAARGGVEQGGRAIEKMRLQDLLLSGADLRVFVGNSSSDFSSYVQPPIESRDAADEGSARSIANFLLPVTVEDQARTAPRDPYVKVATFGRLDDADVKGIWTLLDAVGRLKNFRTFDHRRVQLQLVGANPGNEPIRVGGGPTVELPYSAHSESLSLLDGCSVVLLPSAADALGLVALEALARGRVCLVSDAAGVASAFRRHGHDDWVIPSGRPKAWAERIKMIVNGHPETNHRAALELAHDLRSDAARSNEALGKAIQGWIDGAPEDAADPQPRSR